MRANGYNLGGEQSGHLVYLDHATTGDGVVAALLLLAAARRTGKRVSEIKRCIEIFPQTLVNVKVERKTPIAELTQVGKAIAAAELELGTEGQGAGAIFGNRKHSARDDRRTERRASRRARPRDCARAGAGADMTTFKMAVIGVGHLGRWHAQKRSASLRARSSLVCARQNALA